MAESVMTKGKKERSCARARRRPRKPSASVDSSSEHGGTTAARATKAASRWVRVSGPAAPRRLEGTGAQREEGEGAESDIGKDPAVDSQQCLASPSTPSQHLLPVALFSPAISSGPPVQHSSVHCDASSDATSGARAGTGSHPSQMHEWVPRRASGRARFQSVVSPGESVANPVVDSSEAVPLSGPDSLEGAQELWAAMGPITLWLDTPEQLNSSVDLSWESSPARSGEEPGEEILSDENQIDVAERRRWQEWAKHAAEHERQRRMKILESMDREESTERLARRAWALSAMDEEQRRRGSQEFLHSIQDSSWFQGTINTVDLDYEIVCPYSSLGCRHICLRTLLDKHLAEDCRFNKEPEDADSIASVALVDAGGYEVVCPNTILGCNHSCPRSSLAQHLETCSFTGPDVSEEKAERAKKKEMVLEQVEEERERRVNQGDWQSDSLLHRLCTLQKKTALVILHKEILEFAERCQDIQERRKNALETLWQRMEDVICLLWPDTLIFPYGSYAVPGMMTPDSDLDVMVLPGDQRECRSSRPSAEMADGQPRRRGSRTDSAGSTVLSRIHELADHLQKHDILTSMKVIPHARVPIIKAQAMGVCGSDESFNFNIDISIDGPTHSGLATSAFTSYLSDHLPNLAPLTIVLKSLLQSKGLNDVWTGGISGYGLVLMVAFALLQRDHFPPSPSGSSFVQQSNPTPTERQADVEQPEQAEDERQRALSSQEGSDRNDFVIPPSPGQADNLPLSLQRGPTKKKARPSGGRQRFWQRSSLSGDRSNSKGAVLPTKELKAARKSGGTGSASSWDRPRQQHWSGWRTARAVLMQDYHAGTPVPAATKRGQVYDGRAGSTSESYGNRSSVPPPPPLPEPVVESAAHDVMAPRSPYISTGEEPVLGELLLDFLHLFGEDFDIGREGFSVRGGGFRFCVRGNPPHPQAGDPIVIEDPLNCMNNVGRSSFGIRQVQKCLFEALTTLKATMVRVNQDGKEVLGTTTTSKGILPHICSVTAATTDEGP
eukprot:g13569.t1